MNRTILFWILLIMCTLSIIALIILYKTWSTISDVQPDSDDQPESSTPTNDS